MEYLSAKGEDSELIRKCLSGERESYGVLVRKYQVRIRRICRSLLSDESRAEEAAQEAFVKAYLSLNSFRDRSSFFTWLYRIAIHLCLDRLRLESRRKTESWESLLEREGEKIQTLISSPKENPRLDEDRDIIHRVLSQIPDDYRVILLLREVEGLSYQEISDTLDCTLDTVKSRLKRTRQELKRKLGHFLKSETV